MGKPPVMPFTSKTGRNKEARGVFSPGSKWPLSNRKTVNQFGFSILTPGDGTCLGVLWFTGT